MSKAQERRDVRAQIVAKAVEAWDASGQEYTCLAVIYDVIRPVIERECIINAALHIRARQCMNLASDIIHRRKYPR